MRVLEVGCIRIRISTSIGMLAVRAATQTTANPEAAAARQGALRMDILASGHDLNGLANSVHPTGPMLDSSDLSATTKLGTEGNPGVAPLPTTSNAHGKNPPADQTTSRPAGWMPPRSSRPGQ